MWAYIPDPVAPTQTRTFFVVGTGWTISDDLVYVGTVLADNKLVWHVMERPSPKDPIEPLSLADDPNYIKKPRSKDT